jgi:LmbE family N-acetylglucosaminyl deacetylase
MVIGRCVLILTAFLSILGGPPPAAGQAPRESGLVATGLLLRQMDGVKRVLMIGAHPDDEDTSLLAALSRRYGAETAYLALTRGEGGQNLIGPELWEGLGIIRTGELEAARHLDGGRQFFTRAFDFGYSKRADEALTLWPRDELLHDVVWIIRKYRPQVVVAVFSGTPRDGHGQHQAAGIMAREAFEAAGDPSRFPEQLAEGVEAWAPAKLFELTWRRPEASTVTVPTGDYDPLLGRSELQLAMESRSFHRSQDMGTFQPMGPRDSGVRLERSRVESDDQGIFSGIDTTLVGAASGLRGSAADETRASLQAYRTALARARTTFGGADPFAVASDLREALGHLLLAREAAAGAAGTELREVLERKIDLAQRAVLAASGIVLDVRADDDLVRPGQRVRVTAQVWNGGPSGIPVAEARLSVPDGWSYERISMEGLRPDGALDPQSLATWTFEVTVPEDAPRTEMYYLRKPREGSWYSWPQNPDLWGLPRDPAPVSGVFEVALGDVDVHHAREWEYVGVNPARGEYRRPVLVVPTLSVALSPGALVWPTNRSGSQTLTAAVRTEAGGGARGKVSLTAPRRPFRRKGSTRSRRGCGTRAAESSRTVSPSSTTSTSNGPLSTDRRALRCPWCRYESPRVCG